METPTPESDEVFGPRVTGVRARKCRDLERRLAIAREALQQIADQNEYLTVVVAEHALKQTAPKP